MSCKCVEAENLAWGDGYSSGYLDGLDTDDDTHFAAFENGYEVGFEDGTEVGYEEGAEAGYEAGYHEGFSIAARGALEAAGASVQEEEVALDDECECNDCLSLDIDALYGVANALEERIEAVEMLVGVKFVG